MTTPANLRPDAFVGTAEDYARYRPPYPAALLVDLTARAGGGGALLDLACGPGRVALDLADRFETVWAMDLEPEMVAVGQAEAARRGVGNVRWSVGQAEDLKAPAGAFDLITIGEAFHRLDQGVVTQKALAWLKPGGCLATLGGEGFLDGREAWRTAVNAVARDWMRRAFPDGWGVSREGSAVGPLAYEDVLRSAGFTDVGSLTFSVPCDWSADEIVGYLRSMSVCSQRALGDDFAAFEADVRAALGNPTPEQRFHTALSWGYTLGRKPA